MALSIAVQPRNSGFVKLGAKHRYGVVPESIVYSGDLSEYGCMNASFLLKINPQYSHYDLEHYTPIVISDGTTDVWSGRIIGTPTEYGDTGIIHVECHGWGQHLKDDATDYEWAIDDLSRFYNTASGPYSFDINTYQTGVEPQVQGNALVLPCPQGFTMVNSRGCSATIDLGKNGAAKRIVAKLKAANQPGTNNFIVYLRASNSPNAIGGGTVTDATLPNPNSTDSYLRVTATTPTRYVHIFWYYVGPTTQAGLDHSIKVEFVRIFGDTADESGDASNMKASVAISETLDLLCPSFSTNRSRIVATTFNLPQFPGRPGFKYGSELIENANAFHGYKFLLTPNAVPVPIFEPQDSVHSFVVGAQDDYKFSDPSRNDGRSVFSRVISEYTGTDGVPDYAEASGTTWGKGDAFIGDGGFESTMTTWNFYSSVPPVASSEKVSTPTPQAGSWCLRIPLGSILQGLAQGLKPGKKYKISFYCRSQAVSSTAVLSPVYPGSTNDLTFSVNNAGWTLCEGVFTAATGTQWAAGSTGLRSFSVRDLSGTGHLYVDSFDIEEVIGNVVNRRGFQRTALRPISARSTAAAASALATLDLSEMNYPPLKGKLELSGSIRGANNDKIPVSRIPSSMGKIVLLEQFKDPNTGAVGRKAPIKQAEYIEAEDKVTIDLDDNNNFISNLKNRIL